MVKSFLLILYTVVATTKVVNFKQITTTYGTMDIAESLLLLPQR